MKNLVLLFIPVAVLASCDGTNPSELETSYYQNAKITAEYPYLSEGDSVVLHRFYQAEDEEQIADDEYSEDLYVQIAADISSFDYDLEDLQSLKMSFYPHCFCPSPLGQVLTAGELKGEKKNDTWKVTGFVKVKSILQYDYDSSYVSDHEYHIEINHNFTLKSLQ